MDNVIGIVVTYSTPKLIEDAIKSIKRFYPDLKILIVDGSQKYTECFDAVDRLVSRFKNIKAIHTNQNIGHGLGMDLGINMSEEENILVFDSDIEMKKPCIEKMHNILYFSKFVYGVGQIVISDESGHNATIGFPYLHPHFALIKRSAYNKYSGFHNHGAPCIKSMREMHKSKEMYCKEFPVGEFVLHKERGTRNVLAKSLQAKNHVKQ